MLFKASSVAVLTALLSTSIQVCAEKLSLYGGPQCTGDPEGVVYDSQGVSCRRVPVDAQSVVLDVQYKNDAATITFYSSTDCSGTVEASGNAGCVDFTGLGGNAQSYKLSQSRKRKARDAANWWDAEAELYRNLLGLSAENATGSLAPSWDPYVMVESGFGHGNITYNWNQTWKWQQVALGVLIGIPLEDWDDEVHVLSEQFVVFGDDDYDAMLAERGIGQSQDLELMRRWNYANCRSLLECGRQIADGVHLNIGNGWAQACKGAYKMKTYGMPFYDWAKRHPFVVAIAKFTAGSFTGYGIGKGLNKASAQDNDQLASCADNSQLNAFIQALTEGANANGDNSGQVEITLPNGHILGISAAVYPKGHKPPADQLCGA